MKRMIFALLLAASAVSSTGCRMMDNMVCARGHLGCRDQRCGRLADGRGDSCGKRGCGLLARRRGQEEAGYGGPMTAQVTYPYYSNRGPRDFLAPNPRGIGP